MTEEAQQPVFQIQRVYLKDLSLEQPNSPAIFLEQEAPNIEVAVDVGVDNLAEGIYESTVTITVTAKINDKVAFLVEGKQAGIFEARNIPPEQIEALLGIGCPNIVYPYLRANIADAITRAGFPPVHLSEINFEVFFQQRQQALAEQAAGGLGEEASVEPDPSAILAPDSVPTKH
ncbi:MAG: protein-export chaperone SecB [Burkholderiaceae bacterium]